MSLFASCGEYCTHSKIFPVYANTHIAVFSKQEVAVISISVAHSPGDCIFECVIYDCIDMFGGRRIYSLSFDEL